MNAFQFRTFLVLLAVGLGTNTAWSSQDYPAMSATEQSANVLKDASAKSGMNDRIANERRPIVVEEDIPAFLRTDSCDTGDS